MSINDVNNDPDTVIVCVLEAVPAQALKELNIPEVTIVGFNVANTAVLEEEIQPVEVFLASA